MLFIKNQNIQRKNQSAWQKNLDISQKNNYNNDQMKKMIGEVYNEHYTKNKNKGAYYELSCIKGRGLRVG